MTKRPICPTRFPTRKPARKSSRPPFDSGFRDRERPSPRTFAGRSSDTAYNKPIHIRVPLFRQKRSQGSPEEKYSEKPAIPNSQYRIVSFFMQQIRPTPQNSYAPIHPRRIQQPTVPPQKSTKQSGGSGLTLRLQYRFSVEYRTTPEANGTRPGVVHPRISNVADHTDRGSKTNRVRSA